MYACVTVLALGAGTAAMAQDATESTTTQTTAMPPPPPPPGTLSTTHVVHAQDPYGNTKDAKSTTYRDSSGVMRDSQTTTTTAAPPPPPPVSTSTTTTDTQSGPQ
jgi:hypothetical protein